MQPGMQNKPFDKDAAQRRHREEEERAVNSIISAMTDYDYVMIDTNIAMDPLFPKFVANAMHAYAKTKKPLIMLYPVLHELRKNYEQAMSSTNPSEVAKALYSYTGMFGVSKLKNYGAVEFVEPLKASSVLDSVTQKDLDADPDDALITHADKSILFFVSCCFNDGKSLALITADKDLRDSTYMMTHPACVVEDRSKFTVFKLDNRNDCYGRLCDVKIDAQLTPTQPVRNTQNNRTPQNNQLPRQQKNIRPRNGNAQQQTRQTAQDEQSQATTEAQPAQNQPQNNARDESTKIVAPRPAHTISLEEFRALQSAQLERKQAVPPANSAAKRMPTFTEMDTKLIPIVDGTLIIPEGFDKISAVANSEVVRIVLPSSMVRIMPRAFEKCPMLRAIVVPTNVTRIDDGAFIDCKGVVVYCEEGSYAHEYLRAKKIPYEILK